MDRSDIYTDVTNIIVKSLEEGQVNGKWEMPWHKFSSMPQNAVTKKQYRGVNVPLLWICQQQRGYISGYWATYKQWQEAGAQVRKGEKGSPIVFWKSIDIEPADEEAENRMFARYSTVFNAAQVDGYICAEITKPDGVIVQKSCQDFVLATGAAIEHGDFNACYIPKLDKILMPMSAHFNDTKTSTATENYYSTLLHELTHWTSANHRLDRKKGKFQGNCAYAFEELIAELGSAMLCTSLGVTPSPRTDHMQYIKGWLEALNSDKRFIFSAASQAQKAVDYLYSLHQQKEVAV